MARPLSPTTKFILSLPNDLPVAEVVAKAEEAGLPTSKGNVYQVRRSHAKAHTKDSKATKSVKVSKKAKAPKKGTKKASKTETSVPSAGSSKATRMSKAEYVRSFASDVKPAEIMKNAEKDGVKLTLSYVYNLRRTAKASAAPAAPKKRGPGRPPKAAAAPKATPKAASGAHSSDEAAFRAAVSAYAVDYGLMAARAVLEDVGERIKAAGAS